MHYDINYDNSKSAEKKVDRKALNDFLFYTGKRPFKTLVRCLKFQQPAPSENQIRLYASFAGVQGRPVTALICRYNRAVLIGGSI